MLIRQEKEDDYREIYNLIKEAFASAEHSDGKEQDLVDALREGEAYIPELSLLSVSDSEMAGHIMFTKALVGEREVLVLAPLSVKPKFQKQGIGLSLIKEGHRIAKDLGYEYAIVLGSENYYPKVGYVPAEQYGIILPEGMPSANFMAIKLQEEADMLSGVVRYAKEFKLD